MPVKPIKTNRYLALISKIFFDNYEEDLTFFEFPRSAFEEGAATLGITTPKNIGDVLYSVRFRTKLPQEILDTQPDGMEWIIEGAGRAKYRFKLVKINRIIPRDNMICIAIPDATPELIRGYALDDEQALLAIVRYNRLIDTFLGLTTYSLQNHLRTTVKGIGQIEIDELYVGIDKMGCHYVIPVQAKGGNDQIGIVQTTQDIRFVEQRFNGLKCRSVSVQFMADQKIAMFELCLENDEIKVVDERHYKLVPSSDLSPSAIRSYRS